MPAIGIGLVWIRHGRPDLTPANRVALAVLLAIVMRLRRLPMAYRAMWSINAWNEHRAFLDSTYQSF
jgi:hypothetical protein